VDGREKPQGRATSVAQVYDSLGLSPFPLKVKTYPIEYPSINRLLCLLDDSDPNGQFLTTEDRKVLILAGLDTIDDFTFISERNLHLSTEIAPNKILALYAEAEQMIASVHSNMQEKLDSMEDIRREIEAMERVNRHGAYYI
jgi:hypothetical protein